MEEDLQSSPELFELSDIAGMVRRQRWPFLALFFSGWLIVWVVSWVLPSVYRSGTLILVEQPAVPEKLVASNINIDLQQQLDSITEQILSRTRLLKIIDDLNLYGARNQATNADALVEKMRKDTTIELVRSDDRKLSAFNIYYQNGNPETAQSATKALADLFITQSLADRQARSENTTRFLEKQLADARDNLARQEARVREFKDKHLGELPSQTAANLQILTGLQSELQAQQDALGQARQRNTYIESLLSQHRQFDPSSTRTGDAGTASLAQVDRELEQLRAQLADLSSRYTDNHPDVRKVQEQIARTESARQRIMTEIKSAAGKPKPLDSSEPKSPAVLELESQLKANQIELATREGKIREAQARVNQYQGRLNMSPVMEQQFADINRDYDQSKADYDSLLAKKNQSEMATDLEKTQQGEHFRMLDPPNRPTRPFQPNRLRLCGLGLGAGLVLGAIVGFGREKLSGKLYTEKEIKKLLPFDMIAEIPAIESPTAEAARLRGHWMAGAAAAVILGVVLFGSAITYLYG